MFHSFFHSFLFPHPLTRWAGCIQSPIVLQQKRSMPTMLLPGASWPAETRIKGNTSCDRRLIKDLLLIFPQLLERRFRIVSSQPFAQTYILLGKDISFWPNMLHERKFSCSRPPKALQSRANQLYYMEKCTQVWWHRRPGDKPLQIPAVCQIFEALLHVPGNPHVMPICMQLALEHSQKNLQTPCSCIYGSVPQGCCGHCGALCEMHPELPHFIRMRLHRQATVTWANKINRRGARQWSDKSKKKTEKRMYTYRPPSTVSCTPLP